MIDDDSPSKGGFLRELTRELAALEAAGLRRTTTHLPRRAADFVSNDYLGLARHPAVLEAASKAIEEFGAGCGAARLLGAGAELHDAVETAIANWLGAESALFFPSGYQANLGVIAGLFGPSDAIISDELNHASIIDACRLSRARVEIHPHADLAAIARALRATRGARRRLVVTESIFSMEGDLAPLEAIHRLCREHDALLLVDEAHAVGLLGDAGAGAWRSGKRDEGALLGRIVTGGKALGVAGGFFVGERVVREMLLHRARSFVFTTASPPAVLGALRRSIAIAAEMTDEAKRVLHLAKQVARALQVRARVDAAIVPFVVGDPRLALRAAAECAAAGLDVRAVRPPTVPSGTSRLRIAIHAHNTQAEVERLVRVLEPFVRGEGGAHIVGSPAPRSEAIFVVGTDTGVGKTIASSLLVRALRRTSRVAYWKPVQTGDESDTGVVAKLAGLSDGERIEPFHHFALPASPHTAAEAESASIDPTAVDLELDRHLRSSPDGTRIVVEFAGGLLVPWRLGFDQGDWLGARRSATLLVARSGLGTLNHTGLTLEALRRRAIVPRALLLVGEAHAANCRTLKALHPDVPLFHLPLFDPLRGEDLERWLDANAEFGERFASQRAQR